MHSQVFVCVCAFALVYLRYGKVHIARVVIGKRISQIHPEITFFAQISKRNPLNKFHLHFLSFRIRGNKLYIFLKRESLIHLERLNWGSWLLHQTSYVYGVSQVA